MPDVLAVFALEWVYDRVEERYGRTAAWLATMALSLAVLGIAVAVLIALMR
jgi:predicted PurR-regulated permease PerM